MIPHGVPALIALLSIQIIALSFAEENKQHLQEPCLLLKAGIYGASLEAEEEWYCELQGEDKVGGHFVPRLIKGLTSNWLAANPLISGDSTIFASGVTVGDDWIDFTNKIPIVANGEDEFTAVGRINNKRNITRATGDRTILALRVETADGSSSSAEVISDNLFGSHGDTFNTVTQYKACSYDQLRLSPTPDSRAQDGVYTVTMPISVTGQRTGYVMNEAINRAFIELGDLPTIYDFVVLCLPRDVGEDFWIAFAFVNHWLSVYHEPFCYYTNVAMHGLGHNLNLGHSGVSDNKSGDGSCLMSNEGAFVDDGPKMCFNGPKHFQLGWFPSAEREIDPLTSDWSNILIGVSDYGKDIRGKLIVLRITTTNSTRDYYVHFNRASGINADTVEGRDKVLVSSRPTGLDSKGSIREAILESGEEFIIENFGTTGENVTIRVDNICLNSSCFQSVDHAHVTVRFPRPPSLSWRQMIRRKIKGMVDRLVDILLPF